MGLCASVQPTDTRDDMEREVLEKYVKFTDLEVHVSRLIVNDRAYLDIREYIPSRELYGRGVTLPAAARVAVESGLAKW